jgi:hypothetical protein
MSNTIRIQDLPADQIAALLAQRDTDVTARQAVAIREFVADVGGIQNALAAVEMLRQLRDAA